MIDCSGGGGEDVEDGEIIDDDEEQLSPAKEVANCVNNAISNDERKDSFQDIFGAARAKVEDNEVNAKKPKEKLKRTLSPERNDDKSNRGNRHGGPLRRKRGRDSEDEGRIPKAKQRKAGEKINSPTDDDVDEQEMIYVLGGNSPTYSRFKVDWDSEDDGERDCQHDGDDRGRRRDGYFSNARESRRARLNRGTARQRRFLRKAEVTLCRYFMQGKCSRGTECPFVHNGLPPKKMELCKFYSNDCCTKKDKCLYMHNDFPCKFYHSGYRCYAGKRCKFYHGKISNYLRNIMNKHVRKIDLDREYEQHKKEFGIPDRRDRPNSDKYNERHDKKRSQDEDEEGGSTPMPSPQREKLSDAEGSYSPPERSSHHRRKSREQDGFMEVEEEDAGFGSGDGGSPSHPVEQGGRHLDEQQHHHRHMGGRAERHRLGERRRCRSRDRVRHRDRHRNERPHSPRKDHFNDKLDYDGRRRPDLKGGEFSPKYNDYSRDETESDGNFAEENQLGEDKLPANLPKVQRELIKRIQQQQHQRPPDPQPTEDYAEEDDYKDENWYSSDEDGVGYSGAAEPSPLSTIFNNVPGLKGSMDSNAAKSKSDLSSSSLPASTSMLADIDVNAVTRLLSSVRESILKKETESVASNEAENDQKTVNSLSSSVTSSKPAEDKRSRDPRLRASSDRKVQQITPPVLLTNADLDLRLSDPQTGVACETGGYDVDLRKLPFKPVPHHQAGTEIDASINSHPPIEYRLASLPIIRPDYSSVAKRASVQMGALDPRLRKYMSAQVTQCVVMMSTGGGMPPVVSQSSGLPMMMPGMQPPPMEPKMTVQPPPQINMMPTPNDPRTTGRETKALLANDPRRRGAAAAAAAASRPPAAVLDHDHRIGLLPHPRPPVHFLPHPEADIDLRVHPARPQQNYYQ